MKKLDRTTLAVAVAVCVIFCMSSIEFADSLPSPPVISIITPNNQTTYNNSVPLTITAQTYGTFYMDGKEYGWGIVSFSYSLDSQANVTMGISNATLTNLMQGQHSVVIYGERELLLNGFLSTGIRDTFSSDRIYFIVNSLTSPSPSIALTSSPTPSVPEFPSWTIPLLLSIMLVTAGLLVSQKKTQTQLSQETFTKNLLRQKVLRC